MLGVLAKYIQCQIKEAANDNFLAEGVMVSTVTFATMKSWHVVCEQTRVRMRRALDYFLNRHHAFKRKQKQCCNF